MYDEFEFLVDYQYQIDQKIFNFLKGFIEDKANGRFILVGSEKIFDLPEQKRFLDLLGSGVQIPVPCLEEQNVSSVFCSLKKYVPYEDELLPYLLVICDGQPRILHTFYNAILSYMRKRPISERKLSKKDLEEILNDIITREQGFLYQLRSRLSHDSFWITRLISRHISEPRDRLEYTIDQLANIKQTYFPDSSVDWERGLKHLESQGWIEWKDKPQKFLFKLGLFPLWVRRYDIE